jgi:ADP-heptose:LPS heptosyltransferase
MLYFLFELLNQNPYNLLFSTNIMEKIAIIKLGAKGDVIRTFPVIKAIKEQHINSEINLITRDNIKELLENLPYVDKVFSIPFETYEEFDILYNFDIDDEATFLANNLKAKEKKGFFKDSGFVSAFNLGSEYYLNTLFDDETKISNTKTYQEMMFMAAEIPYKKEHTGLILNERDLQYADIFLRGNKINKEKLIGIHMGASPRWPSKVWDEENLEEFVIKSKNKGYEILLFGGPQEVKSHRSLIEKLDAKGIHIFRNNPYNTDGQFASLVNSCKTMVCSDSFSLHISIALKRPTIGLFFSTPYHEIESYGYLNVIASPRLKEFFPEKMDQYDKDLTQSISANQVLEKIENIEEPKPLMKEKTLLFDIDGTICRQVKAGEGYHDLEPFSEAIDVINKLYDEGFKIIFYTSRFMGFNKGNVINVYRTDGYAFTRNQLEKWGVKFHELHMGKPQSHLVIDDRSIFFEKNWGKIYESIKSKIDDFTND